MTSTLQRALKFFEFPEKEQTLKGRTLSTILSSFSKSTELQRWPVDKFIDLCNELFPDLPPSQEEVTVEHDTKRNIRHAYYLLLQYLGLNNESTATGKVSTLDEGKASYLLSHYPQLRAAVLRVMRFLICCDCRSYVYGLLLHLYDDVALHQIINDEKWLDTLSKPMAVEIRKLIPKPNRKEGAPNFDKANQASGHVHRMPSVVFPPVANFDDPVQIKICSSNVESFFHYAHHFKGDNEFDAFFRIDDDTRVQNFKRFVTSTNALIYCLQECDDGWVKRIGKGESGIFPKTFTYAAPEKPCNLRVYYCAEQLELLCTFAESTVRVLVCIFQHSKTKNIFAVVNSHARFNAMKDNVAVYQKYLSKLEGIPVIAMGDWNTDFGADPSITKQETKGRGNENIEVLRKLFPSPSWNDLTKTISFTARSVVGIDVFEKIDFAFATTLGIQSASCETSPSCDHGNRLLPLGMQETHEKSGMAMWSERQQLAKENYRGTPAVQCLKLAVWDKFHKENHFSDHAALIINVVVAAKELPKGLPAVKEAKPATPPPAAAAPPKLKEKVHVDPPRIQYVNSKDKQTAAFQPFNSGNTRANVLMMGNQPVLPLKPPAIAIAQGLFEIEFVNCQPGLLFSKEDELQLSTWNTCVCRCLKTWEKVAYDTTQKQYVFCTTKKPFGVVAAVAPPPASAPSQAVRGAPLPWKPTQVVPCTEHQHKEYQCSLFWVRLSDDLEVLARNSTSHPGQYIPCVPGHLREKDAFDIVPQEDKILAFHRKRQFLSVKTKSVVLVDLKNPKNEYSFSRATKKYELVNPQDKQA